MAGTSPACGSGCQVKSETDALDCEISGTTSGGLATAVRTIVAFKSTLDANLSAHINERATLEQEDWLNQYGFGSRLRYGQGISPERFARCVFGPFRKATPSELASMRSFPSSIAIGWNRRQYQEISLDAATFRKSKLDEDTRRGVGEYGYASYLSSYQVLIADEGKHRVDMLRHHNLDIFAKVREVVVPTPGELELVQIFGTNDVWGLRCSNPEFRTNFRGPIGPIAALPLPHLSVPFFQAYGVRRRPRRCFPWQVSLGLIELPKNLFQRRPSRWRQLILGEY